MRGPGNHAGTTREHLWHRRLLRPVALALVLACLFASGRSLSVGDVPEPGSSAPRTTGFEPKDEQAPSASAGSAFEGGDNDGVIEAGTEVLGRYEATPGCSLVYAGYIDLFGNVWACLVAGPGWAELSVVRATQDGSTRTTCAHIDSELLRSLGNEDP